MHCPVAGPQLEGLGSCRTVEQTPGHAAVLHVAIKDACFTHLLQSMPDCIWSSKSAAGLHAMRITSLATSAFFLNKETPQHVVFHHARHFWNVWESTI